MKKFMGFFAAMMLLLCFSGQAMAYFEQGNLIQVVYKTGGTGNEVLTDLGDASAWINSGSVPTSTLTSGITTSSLSTLFPGASWSDLNVAFFIMNGIGAQANFWTSGPETGQTNNALKSSTKNAMNLVLQLAATNGTAQVTQASSTQNSYYQALDKNGVAVGRFNGYVNESGEANLASLASGGSTDLYLYYYPNATNSAAGTGLQVARLTVFADGHTEVDPASQSAGYTLSLSKTGNGSVAVNGTAQSLPWSGQYDPDAPVQLQATADEGYTFSGWSGDLTGSENPATFSMTGDMNIMANFTQNTGDCTLTLTTTLNPSGSGTITKNPDQTTYCAGDQVTLTASPETGYDFSSWSGDQTGTNNPVTITMDGNKTVTANFTQNTVDCTLTLTTTLNPSGSGTITKNPDQETYCPGDHVTLTANPASGYAFSSWDGADSSNGTSASVTLNSNKTVTANFTQIVTNGPDLTGSWESCVQQCKGSKCKLNGKFQVKNDGNESASSSSVKFYLSYDDIFGTDDSLLKEMKIVSLKAGKSKTIKLNYSLASDLSATDKYIIAVIDPDNKVTETLENNNTIVYGPVLRANLTGLWSALVQKCTSSKKGDTCSLTGKLTIGNNGDQNAASSVAFYLSDNSTYEAGDTLLKQVSTGTLKPGQSRIITLKTKLSTGISATGKYVIAVIDQDNTVPETNEGDNMVISEPLE